MTLVEFAEHTSEIPLSNFQKDFLERFDNARKQDKIILTTFPRCCGRGMLLDIIREFEKEENNKNLVADEGKSTLLSNEAFARGSE